MKQFLLAMGAALLLAIPVIASPGFKNNRNYKKDFFQRKPITGKVTDDKGQPLSDVTVQVKGSRVVTISKADGTFTIDVPDGKNILVITYAGMESQEVNVSGKTDVEVQLKNAENVLSDVVVVGYGTQKKTSLTGSVSSVNGSTLIQRPAPNAANLIQGRVTGLQVTEPSGEPGRDNPTFLIRGRGSFNQGTSNAPLILIDGVTGSFNNLSPDDIENITVLKDASSSAIYGARGANGVILITTKKGKKGQSTVSYRINVSRHSATALPDFITNSADYMTMYNAAATRSGIAFKYAQSEIDKYRNATDRNQYPNFDNVDYYINPALVMNHNLSVSGGTDKSTYNLSLGYLDQDALLRGYKYRKYNLLLNYTTQVSNAVTVGTVMNLTYKDRKEPPFTSENLALAVYAAGPLYGPFLPDGSGRIVSRAYLNEGRNRNPQEYYAMGTQTTREYNMNAQAYIDIKLLKGLLWSSKAAVNYTDEYYKMYQHPYTAYLLQERDPATNDYFTSPSAFFGPDVLGVTDQYTKTITPTIYSTLTYDKKIATDHQLKVLAGYEQLYFRVQSLRGRRTSSVAPVLTDLTGYSPTGESLYFNFPRLPTLVTPSEWSLQSLFGRVNYSYKNKYFLEGNLRYDGTSKVSPDYRWGTFPSISAGWLISEEDFFRNKFDWVNNMKLRASYGVLGNQDVGTYLFQNNLAINAIYPFGNSTALQGAVVNDFRDQSLKWESTKIIDYGFDLSLSKGILGITLDWFRKTTFDILAAQPVPASLGLNAPTLNDGEMRNQGIELELTHQYNIGPVTYGANFLISTAKNKLLHIRVPSKGTSINQEGLPYGAHFLYIWDGIFQEEDIGNPKVPKHALNPNPKAGDLKMKDIDGDGDVDPDDRVVVGGAYPDYIYSFGINAGYKGFSLNAFFQGVQGLKNRVTGWGVDPFHQGSAPTEKWRDAWTPQNRSNTLPGIYVQGYLGVNAYTGSTYYLQDASYLRMKNIILSYTFPKTVFQRIKAKDLSVYVSGDNLFTITKYEGEDPERASTTGNYAQYPQTIILNIGLSVKF